MNTKALVKGGGTVLDLWGNASIHQSKRGEANWIDVGPGQDDWNLFLDSLKIEADYYNAFLAMLHDRQTKQQGHTS